jgi:transposase
MDVVYERCCGLDVHKKRVVACLLTSGAAGEPVPTVRTFGTMTADLDALAAWLSAAGCTHVALESTGVYWKPLYNRLEEHFTLLLVNPQHIKAVPGRKTDVKDSEWLATLLRHGLLRGSFVPDRTQRELRELTRYRTALVQERAAEIKRLQATLEGANLKLAAVATDVRGQSARAILTAVIGGETAPAVLAELARGKLRAKLPALEQALTGSVGAHQRFLLAHQLAHLDDLDGLIAEVDAEVAERLRPFEATLERLDAIPGVGRRTAEVLLAELGRDMTRFPSAGHAAAWAGVAPGQRESAGRRAPCRARQGNRYLRAALVEAGQAAGRKRDSYLAARYQRLARRRGKPKAALAVGHTVLVIAYSLLRDGTTYTELGSDYLAARREVVTQQLVRKLEGLGYHVSLTPPAPAA